MHKAQLARLPAADGRRAERRVVNLAASLREPGASVVDAEIVDLSTEGFKATSAMVVEPGQFVWLKLAGLGARKSQAIWAEGGKAGFKFTAPLHPSDLDQLVETERKALPRGHFGPQGVRS
jgi:hypothetical protein